MKLQKSKIVNIVREEIRNLLDNHDDFSDLDGSQPEATSFEPESEADNVIQIAVTALLEALYKYEPAQELLDNVEEEAIAALSNIRGSIDELINSRGV